MSLATIASVVEEARKVVRMSKISGEHGVPLGGLAGALRRLDADLGKLQEDVGKVRRPGHPLALIRSEMQAGVEYRLVRKTDSVLFELVSEPEDEKAVIKTIGLTTSYWSDMGLEPYPDGHWAPSFVLEEVPSRESAMRLVEAAGDADLVETLLEESPDTVE